MNRSFRPVLSVARGLLSLLVPLARAVSQETAPPAVVISLASADKLMADTGYLTKAVGMPEFGGLVTLMAGQYLEGIDARQPAGAYVTLAGKPTVVAFVPVSDFDVVSAKLEEAVGELEDAGDGVKKLALQRDIFLKPQGKWVFVSDAAANLANLPEDPTSMLGDLSKQYNLAVRFNVQSVPMEMREKVISEMKEGFEQTLERETDAEKRDVQEQFGRPSLEEIVRLINEADQVTLGWGVDSEGGATYIDFSATAIPGSKLAEEVAQYAQAKTKFAGFLTDDAAAKLQVVMPLSSTQVQQAKSSLKLAREKALAKIDEDEELPTPEARAAAKEIVGSLIDVIDATISEGLLDGGASLLLAPNQINFIAGGFVSDGAAIEKNLKRLVELAKSSGETPQVDLKFNAAQHKGVAFHTVSIPIPEKEDEARKVLGEKLLVVVGNGPQSVYFGLGEKSLDLLRQAIDASAAAGSPSVMPFTLDVAAAPIVRFAASVGDDKVVAALAQSLQEHPENDHVRVTSKSIERGISYRVEVQEGVLQLIGQAIKAQNAQNRDPF